MNEFNEELVKFIEETTEKAVGEYALKNDLDHELLVTACNTLMSFLIYKGIVDRAELQSAMDEALGKKVSNWNAENFGDKSEDKKIIFLNSCVVVKN